MFDLVRYRRPERDLFHWNDWMDRLFDWHQGDDFLRGFSPSVDVMQNEEQIKIRAEVPGLDKESLDVTVEGDLLTLSGDKKEESKGKNGSYEWSERRYGKFSRSFTLPKSADSSKIEAHYKDGILEVVIPKRQEAQPKKISVQAS